MSEFIRQLGALPGAAARIWAQPFTREMRLDILKAHLEMNFISRKGYRGQVAGIGNYKIEYGDWELYVAGFREIFIDGCYSFVTPETRPVVLDCGANIGMATLYFKARFPEAVVNCFEPSEDAFNLLEKNISRNGLRDVVLNRCALASKQGEEYFWYAPDRVASHGNSFKRSSRRKRILVKTVRLSEYVSGRVDFLKLDVEGAETEVVDDLFESGKISLIRQMYIEYHHHPEGEEGTDGMARLLSRLESAGFGYQIETNLLRPLRRSIFQTIGVYAYNKAGL